MNWSVGRGPMGSFEETPRLSYPGAANVPVATGDSVQLPNARYIDILAAASIASLTLIMPANLVNEQVVTITFQQDVTDLTVSGAAFLLAPPTSAAAGSSITWRWKKTEGTWWPA